MKVIQVYVSSKSDTGLMTKGKCLPSLFDDLYRGHTFDHARKVMMKESFADIRGRARARTLS